MNNLPRPLAAYILATAAAALAVAVAAAFGAEGAAGGRELYYMAALTVLVAAASHFPLHIGPRAQIYMDTAPVIAAAILLPPPLALAACGVGKLAANTWNRVPPFQALFNVSTMVVQAGLASLTYSGLASRTQWADAAAMAAASFVLVTSNACLVEGIVSVHVGKRPFAGFWGVYGEDIKHQVSLLMLGLFAALIADARPWALPLLAVPSAVVYRSLRYQHLTIERSEASKSEAEEARARLTAIVEATPDLVATADPRGRLLYLNSAGRRLVGLDAEADLGEMRITDAFADWEERAASALRDGAWMGESALRSRTKKDLPVSQVIVVHGTPGSGEEFLSTVARDIRERKRFEARLVVMASSDPLTGLLNRRSFDSGLGRRLRNRHRPGAVLFVDLDGFKEVNDNFGHATGDDLLLGLARLMRGAYGGRNLVARLGGDEFGVFLPGIGAADAEAAAADLVARIAAFRLMAGGEVVALTASVGVALHPVDASSAEELIAHADAAMYRAKRVGNSYAMFSRPRAREGSAA